MAFYSSNFFSADYGEYNQNPSRNCYDFASPQSSVAYPGYQFIHGDYNPISYSNQSIVSYSAYSFSQPKFIEHAIPPYIDGQDLAPTQFAISYSISEFDDSHFEEYDPTPYGGGYDLAATYGKPLPPSDKICYPRSSPEPHAPPHGKEEVGEEKPSKEIEPTRAVDEQEKQPPHAPPPPPPQQQPDNFSVGPVASSEGKEEVDGVGAKSSDEIKQSVAVDEEVEEPFGGGGDDSSGGRQREAVADYYYPWSCYENGYGREREMPGPPYGFNPDVMDICEGLFGYWPCLYRKERRNYGDQRVPVSHSGEESCGRNTLEKAADYVFGDGHGYGHGHGYMDSQSIGEVGYHGDLIHGYERHYEKQPQHVIIEDYDEQSWVQKFNIF